MAEAVVKLGDIEKLQEFGDQHAEDLSARTRKLLSQHYRHMESGHTMHQDAQMQKERHR